ncbi:alpha-L-fucosidase [Pseudoflavitalea sp. G-6-1-2]|uniref:alpha-L-fucosidase n=1 Tax=Pseudoflavitalea sp. G-6-1-2 TaxID=2728841 RepID=UPI00146F231A|nr:alpha-L-fucosidase [Pseudoflavitalea sp. G-6-1-2]NML23831.1 alpha-L-fucosidase [Pseudoflavitalea sp. G-6-1-2]
MRLIRLLVVLMLLSSALNSTAQPVTTSNNDRVQWFTDARFGMFIHWGLYSAAEGIWHGERLRNGNNYAEWIRYRNRISREEYGALAKRFDWSKINPEEWVLAAKKAGMKYIVITAKHHDGVAIWNSKVSDYNLSKLCNTNRDVIKELSVACRKHGIKLAFYYSHWLDWEHPFGWDHNQEITGRVTDEQYNQYWQQKVLPQLRELLTNYGDIAMLWFDMWVDHKTTIVKKEQLQQVIQLIHELQPKCLINSRLGLSIDNPGIDFETMGDNEFGAIYQKHPWETAGTIAHSWGYNALENQWKSTSQLLQSLIDNVSLNGNFTLNIGPRADGSIPYEGIRRLEDIGVWLAKSGESIYKSIGVSLRPSQHDWGRITTHNTGTGNQKIYLQVYNWPLDHILRVTGITTAPQRVELIRKSGRQSLPFTLNGPLLHIRLPQEAGDPFVSTIELSYDAAPAIEAKVIAESSFGGFALTGENITGDPSEFELVKYDGLRPAHMVMNKPGTISWRFYAPEAGKYSIDVSYHNGAKEKILCSVEMDGKQIQQALSPTSRVVVEPNGQYTDEFVNVTMGAIEVSKAGYYQVTAKFDPRTGDKFLFNRIWLNKLP